MITRVPDAQVHWFTGWVESTDSIPDDRFARWIVLLHPGTTFVEDDRFPIQSPNVEPAVDEDLSDEQAAVLDHVLLDYAGPDAICDFALYAGYFNEKDRGRSSGFLEPENTWYQGRLNYVLLSGELADCTFAAVRRRWGDVHFTELSYLWARDHSWFLASTADTCVTVVGCNDGLAAALLAEPLLNPHEWIRD